MNEQSQIEERLVRTAGAAHLLGCSRWGVWNLARAGRLPVVRIHPGAVPRFRVSDLLKIMHPPEESATNDTAQ